MVEQNSRMRLSLTMYPIYILSIMGFSRFDAVWITRTPPMKREMTPTRRIDDIMSLSASMTHCLQKMRHFSGLLKTFFKNRRYLPADSKKLLTINYLPVSKIIIQSFIAVAKNSLHLNIHYRHRWGHIFIWMLFPIFLKSHLYHSLISIQKYKKNLSIC